MLPSLLHLNADHYWLTEFSGEWAHEANMTERQLDFGKKNHRYQTGRPRQYVLLSFLFSLAESTGTGK